MTTATTTTKSTARPAAGCTPRVQQLRERVLHTEPSICVERGLLVTEAHEKWAADPPVLRRAKALAHVLDHMSIYIEEGELVVGNQASAPRAAPLFPEYLVDFMAAEIDEFDKRPADRYQVARGGARAHPGADRTRLARQDAERPGQRHHAR